MTRLTYCRARVSAAATAKEVPQLCTILLDDDRLETAGVPRIECDVDVETVAEDETRIRRGRSTRRSRRCRRRTSAGSASASAARGSLWIATSTPPRRGQGFEDARVMRLKADAAHRAGRAEPSRDRRLGPAARGQAARCATTSPSPATRSGRRRPREQLFDERRASGVSLASTSATRGRRPACFSAASPLRPRHILEHTDREPAVSTSIMAV